MGTLIPGRENSSEDVSTRALYIHASEAVHHGNRKALVTLGGSPEAELCECLFLLMCAYIHAHWKRGRANTHQTCTQTGASIRSLLDLLSCWVSCTASAQRLEPGVKIRTQKYLLTPLFCPSGPVLARTLQITSASPVQLELPSFAAVPSPLPGLQTRGTQV